MSFLFRRVTTTNRCDIGQVTIDILPDDVLLEIFDYNVAETDKARKFEEWQRASSCELKMAICCISVTKPEPPESPVLCLPERPVSEGEASCLASVAYRYSAISLLNLKAPQG